MFWWSLSNIDDSGSSLNVSFSTLPNVQAFRESVLITVALSKRFGIGLWELVSVVWLPICLIFFQYSPEYLFSCSMHFLKLCPEYPLMELIN